MSQPYVGQMTIFAGNFAISGWAFCDGRLLAISQFSTLFNLIGTTYGGDGQSTFGLPNMQSRVAVGMGTTSGTGTNYFIGQTSGTEQVTVSQAQLPVHSHTLNATSATASSQAIGSTMLPANTANVSPVPSNFYVSNTGTPPPTFLNLSAATIGPAGGGVGHENRMPFLAMTYLISLFGIYPSQN
jgi:microcystin-dependent protein